MISKKLIHYMTMIHENSARFILNHKSFNPGSPDPIHIGNKACVAWWGANPITPVGGCNIDLTCLVKSTTYNWKTKFKKQLSKIYLGIPFKKHP